MAALATVPSKPQTKNLPPGYHDVNETAEILRCGVRWLRDGVNHRGFPHARLGKVLVFSDADIAAIYEMHRTPAHQPRRRRAA